MPSKFLLPLHPFALDALYWYGRNPLSYQRSCTAVRFLNSDKFGKKYENDLFVASFNRGVIYHFELNENRTSLKLSGAINSTLAEDQNPKDLIFARGLGGITDMHVGPDGNFYILSRYFSKPTIFKISNTNVTTQ